MLGPEHATEVLLGVGEADNLVRWVPPLLLEARPVDTYHLVARRRAALGAHELRMMPKTLLGLGLGLGLGLRARA